MPFFILTERLKGDYAGTFVVLQATESLAAIKRKKKAIIKTRTDGSKTSEWLFGKTSREEQEAKLEIYQKIE